ncbi:MAG: prephenate dehydrogenase/arogenate dehydrogenase family protein [Anaerolineae bacterium]|nr:prephenate dehydrogenase/arogenate dehydrogenase family protein [Anaerolineae bacterium]
MATQPRITIIGTGLIGASLGMSILTSRGREVEVLGHDRDHAQAGLARRMGAISKVDRNLISAASKADMVILAIPAPEIRETLELIANDLKPGCIVHDTASIKAPVMEWAHELLPREVSYVGGDPILTGEEAGIDEARADLFAGCRYCITPSNRASSEAIQLVTDLVAMTGAIPHRIGPHEHDRMVGATEHLADILAVTFLHTLTSSGGWRDMRRMAGATFDRVTCFSTADAAEYRGRALYNRDNILPWLERMQDELSNLRALVERSDGDAIEAYFARQPSDGDN